MPQVRNEYGPQAPKLEFIDHVHVYTPDRAAAEVWYAQVLGLIRISEFEHWATKDGPLFLTNLKRSVTIALFERPPRPTRSTIAFRVNGQDFLVWRKRLREMLGKIDEVDHEGSWSLYFSDPDGNPFEITSYDYEWLKKQLRP
jgi:catechol-2,3-dioxygenase